MSTLVHDPARDCVSPLGIPVDNLSLAQAVDAIVALARRRDGRSRLVSTLNVDFLVNALGTGFRRARHPELLGVLRDSDLVTADGFPILWLSRIVGRPLRERVCGSDLVPALAGRSAREGLSLFLLGGGKGVAPVAAGILADACPGLRIAGTAAPDIAVAGPAVADCNAGDEALVEDINASGADILLIGLGNPKQELWFNRNRDRLKVPVAIGVGGTFEFIAGKVRRAPSWAQRLNLEWLYRISQDPGRLWRRYAEGVLKLGLLSAPLVWERSTQALAFLGRRIQEAGDVRWNILWSSREQSLAVLRLPALVGRDYLQAVVSELQSRPHAASMRLLDFSGVRRVELSAHAQFLALAELQQREDRDIRILGMPESLRRQLAAGRVLDVLQTGEGSALTTLAPVRSRGNFSCRSYRMRGASLTCLSGRISGRALQEVGLAACLEQVLERRDCIVDLRQVRVIESTAVAALLQLAGRGGGGRLLLSGASPNIRQMFRVAATGPRAEFIDDRQFLRLICEGGAGK